MKNPPVLGNRERYLQNLKRWFRFYCENTTIHGFRYITLVGATVVESIVWFVVCLAAIVFCMILMLRMWNNFSKNPTVTIIDTSNPIWQLPFPGVTICNNNKVYKPHADKIAEKLSSNAFDSDMINKFFSSLMKLIRPETIEIDNATASWALDALGYTVEKLMNEVMQPCSALLMRCAWLGQVYDCSKIFKTVKSNEGFCCGFNYHFNSSQSYRYNNSGERNSTTTNEETQEFNPSEVLPGVGHILKAPGAGQDVGLAVALNVESETYKSSVRPYVGATVLIHDPVDYPDIGAHSATILPDHVLSIALTGSSIKSAKEIRNIPLEKRLCLFDGETPGEKLYSFQTCVSDCMYQRLHGFCECLPFFHPYVHDGVRTCYLTDTDCILARRRSLANIQISHIDFCKCFPQCNDKYYSIFAEAVRLDGMQYDSDLTRGLSGKNASYLYVYFRDVAYLEYRKESIMGWDSLLASFGGIFGLCLGGSVISIVELLYHQIMELFNLRGMKRKSRRNFPPASKMFMSVPVKEPKIRKNAPAPVNKQLFVVLDRNIGRRLNAASKNN